MFFKIWKKIKSTLENICLKEKKSLENHVFYSKNIQNLIKKLFFNFEFIYMDSLHWKPYMYQNLILSICRTNFYQRKHKIYISTVKFLSDYKNKLHNFRSAGIFKHNFSELSSFYHTITWGKQAYIFYPLLFTSSCSSSPPPSPHPKGMEAAEWQKSAATKAENKNY